MLPLTLLNLAVGETVSVELKSGAKLDGKLEKCDTHMNVLISQCHCTEADGVSTVFEEFYARGPAIKMVQVPDYLLDKILVERKARREERRFEEQAKERSDRKNQGQRNNNQHRRDRGERRDNRDSRGNRDQRDQGDQRDQRDQRDGNKGRRRAGPRKNEEA